MSTSGIAVQLVELQLEPKYEFELGLHPSLQLKSREHVEQCIKPRQDNAFRFQRSPGGAEGDVR
jgi:hypothetical protein